MKLEILSIFGGFPKSRGPTNKDYSILVSILGSPYFGKLPFGGSGGPSK